MKRVLVAIFLCVMAVAAATKPESEHKSGSESGPYCWAGVDSTGKDVFVPCHPKAESKRVDVYLDGISEITVHVNGKIITVSPERLASMLNASQIDSANPELLR